MVDIDGNLTAVRARIAGACSRTGRQADEVLLVAVTKTVPVAVVTLAAQAGIEDFAENYARELASKTAAVAARWHFIGRLQRGTAHHVAAHATVVHSAVPGHGLDRLARWLDDRGRAIECLIQIDVSGSGNGVAPHEAAALADGLIERPGIRLRGLMTMPPPSPHPEATRPYFARLRELRDALLPAHPQIRELSMGMSGDLEVAVEEGATMVRVGTALFGERPAGRGQEAGGGRPGPHRT